MDWQGKMHVFSCFLYEVDADPALSDESFDQLCLFLLRNYRDTPEWFRQRVSRERLQTGTASGMTYSTEEIAEARAWRTRVRG